MTLLYCGKAAEITDTAAFSEWLTNTHQEPTRRTLMVLYWILRFVSLMNVKKRSWETETYGQGETAKDLTKKTAND